MKQKIKDEKGIKQHLFWPYYVIKYGSEQDKAIALFLSIYFFGSMFILGLGLIIGN